MISAQTNRKALLIDDEAYFRKFVGQVFKKAGFGVVLEARDGREGVKLFQEQRPDIVVLDISMPHMDGLRTLEALRKISAKTPIVMLTSVSEERTVEQCVDTGATFFIRKDVSAPQLSAALQEAIVEFLGAPPSA